MEKYFFWRREYFFEYKTPESQDTFVQAGWFIIWSGTAIFFLYLLFVLITGPEGLIEGIFTFFIFGIIALAHCYYMGRLFPPLTVRVSEGKVFLRKSEMYSGATYKIFHLRQLKRVSLVAYTGIDIERNSLAKYGRGKLWNLESLLFEDGSSTKMIDLLSVSEIRGADLELMNGTRIFVGFNGVEKFVEALTKMNPRLAGGVEGRVIGDVE